MSHAAQQQALKHYSQVGVRSGVELASPHRLIQMLMDGVLSRLAAAVGHIHRGDTAGRGESIGLAITIIGGLQSSLDEEKGGEIATNLNRLYDYMTRTLLVASAENDASKVEHVHALLSEVKAGWDAIGGQGEEEPGTPSGSAPRSPNPRVSG